MKEKKLLDNILKALEKQNTYVMLCLLALKLKQCYEATYIFGVPAPDTLDSTNPSGICEGNSSSAAFYSTSANIARTLSENCIEPNVRKFNKKLCG
jgi:hypothetical protein